MSFTAPQFTNAGKELLSRALSGDCAVKFTSLALGSGELSSQAIAALSGLISEQKRVGLELYQRIDGETVNVRGTFNNSELAAGFYWREVGLFAQNPDDPDNRAADILYCYQNAGDLAEYIPSVNDEVMEKTISLTTKISDAAEVTAVLLSEVYASKEEVEEGYVKKTGDKMSGPLLLSYLLNAAKNGYLFIGAGETVEDLAKSSYLQFYGPDSNSPGKVLLVCRDADGQEGEAIAEWTPEGFKWNGSKVITAAGGKFTGGLTLSDYNYHEGGTALCFFAQTEDVWTEGAHFEMYRGDAPSPGVFKLVGKANGDEVELVLVPGLGIQVNRKIISDANNALEVIRNDNETIAVRAENKGTGQAIRVGIGQTGTRGIYDEKTQHWIVGLNPDNAPIIDGTFAIKTVNGVGAGASGDVRDIAEAGEGYIRFTNGLQICWGYITVGTSCDATVTLPVPFKDWNWSVTASCLGTYETGNGAYTIKIASIASTSSFYCATWFNHELGGNQTWHYQAIGYWK